MRNYFYSYACSLFSQLLLMGKSKLGFMIIWDQELTMMLLVIGVPPCYIVQMEAGKLYFFLAARLWSVMLGVDS